MIRIRYNAEIAGVKVEMLFTPHLYSFAEDCGIQFAKAESADTAWAMDVFSDVFFLAALNAWQLDEKGDVTEFPLTRGDFNGWIVQDPKEFGKCLSVAVQALSGKTAGELEREKAKEKEAENNDRVEKPKKKASTSIIQTLRLFLSGRAKRRSARRR